MNSKANFLPINLIGRSCIRILFFSANLAYAGGGPVEFWVDPNTSLNPGEQYIVHARVFNDGPSTTLDCKNCLIHLKFKDPQGSDYIAQNSDRTDENGTIYAKVISKVPGNRVVYPTDLQTADGKIINSANYVELAYTGESTLPSTPTASPVTQNPKPTISPVQKPSTPPAIISPSPIGENKQVDELNKKVNDLQNQLDQSKKTQSVLEQRISNLVDFIKRLFPFFK